MLGVVFQFVCFHILSCLPMQSAYFHVVSFHPEYK